MVMTMRAFLRVFLHVNGPKRMSTTVPEWVISVMNCPLGRGGECILPTMAYTGRLRPKGVPFSRFRYMKG